MASSADANQSMRQHFCAGLARRVYIHPPRRYGTDLMWSEWVLRFNVYPIDQESPPETFFLNGGRTYADARDQAAYIAELMGLGVVHTSHNIPDMWEIAEGWMTPFEWGFEASLFITRASSTDVADHHLFSYDSFVYTLRTIRHGFLNIG